MIPKVNIYPLLICKCGNIKKSYGWFVFNFPSETMRGYVYLITRHDTIRWKTKGLAESVQI